MAVLDNIHRRKNGPEEPMPPVPMPRAANLPKAKVYDDDVLAQLQRWKDLQTENEQLKAEGEEWRRRALAAEGEVRRLEMRIEQDARRAEQDLAKLDERRLGEIKSVTAELDYQKGECTRVTTLAQAGASVFLKILDQGKAADAPAGDAAGKAGLSAIAAELDPEFREVDEPPVPRVVSAGPRQADEP